MEKDNARPTRGSDEIEPEAEGWDKSTCRYPGFHDFGCSCKADHERDCESEEDEAAGAPEPQHYRKSFEYVAPNRKRPPGPLVGKAKAHRS
jgi:hypothetical protein